MIASPEQRLLSYSVPGSGGCLIWTRARNSKGYGLISIEAQLRLVHRVAHELWIGPIPPGLQVDHVLAAGCTSRLCIEPRHLQAVTNRENNLRRVGVHKAACHQGHALTSLNLRINRNGHWSCRTCARDLSHAYRIAS